MSVNQKKPSNTSSPEHKSRIENECRLFELAVVGGDGNRVIAYNRLRAMTPQERHNLRQSIERLDGILDEVALNLHLERHIAKSNKSNGGGNGNHAS